MRLGVQGHCFMQAAPGLPFTLQESWGRVPRKNVLRRGAAAAAELWNYLTPPGNIGTIPQRWYKCYEGKKGSQRPVLLPAGQTWSAIGTSGTWIPQSSHAPEGGPREGGGRGQDGGDPQGFLVDAYVLPTSQGALGMVRVPLHSDPDQRFPDASEDMPSVNHIPGSGICCLADCKPQVQGALGLLRWMFPLPSFSFSHYP